jgi:hypothetical protein
MDYPLYYRKSGRCIKLLSDKQFQIIVLPPDRPDAERFTTTLPDSSRLASYLDGFEQVEEVTWKEFLYTFLLQAQAELQLIIKTQLT